MAISFITDYPVEATNTSWQTKKSFMDKAKSATKTGLGASLTKAEAAWKKIKFDALDVRSAGGQLGNPAKFGTPQSFDDAKAKAQTHITTVVKPVSKALLDAALMAKKTSQNASLSSTAKAAAAVIEKKLLAASGLLRDINLDDFDTRKAVKVLEMQTVQGNFNKNMVSALGKADTFIALIKRDPKPTPFNNGIQTASRDITQNIANIDKLNAMGANTGKVTPTALLNVILPWAQGGAKLPATANSAAVLSALDKYEKAVVGIKRWNA